ncbi:MAG: radical SAM protein, partial [Thermodesulfobacteriota bacterium]|nr:radical SAM protein [Thermodesulfobacteriota bacterium]
NYPWALKLADKIKKVLDVPIVFGGVHPTSVPEHVISQPSVDFVVVGEGEAAMIDLANNLNDPAACRKIPNVWAKKGNEIIENEVRPLVENLDSLPQPDKEIFYNKLPYLREGYIALTSRGCVNKCTFCNNSLYKDTIYRDKGRFFRRRSPENVLTELKNARDNYPYTAVHFWDEIFISDKKWLAPFLEGYKREINVPFTCCIHVNFIDEEVVSLLKEANCWQAIMGVQSLNEDLKKTILNRRETNEQVRKTILLLKNAGILTICENMLGLPTQTEEDLINMLEFYNETRPNRLSLYFIRYYPKTEIINTALQHNILTEPDVEEINRGLNARSFIQGGTIQIKTFAKIQGFLTFIPVLPRWLNSFLINVKLYRILPRFGMLTHSIARILDRNKKFDVDAYRFKQRYKTFMLKKIKN